MPDLTHLALPEWSTGAAQILLILVVAFVAFRFARSFVHGVFRTLLDREAREGAAQDLTVVELKKRMATLDSLGVNLVQFFIVIIAALMILDRLGLDIGPAIAGLGIVGIAVGFGAQSLVKDYFNGALILVENQYGKGDVVRIAGVEGTVEDLTLRRTTLRDFEGNVHTVPNSAVVVASNLTRGWARISEELQLPSAELVDATTEVVNRVGREMAEDPVWHRRLLEPPHVEGLGIPDAAGIAVRIAGRVAAVHRWTAVGELRRRLLAAFAEHGLPFVPSGQNGRPAAPGLGQTATPAGSDGLDTTSTGPAVGAVAQGGSMGPGQDDLAQGTD